MLLYNNFSLYSSGRDVPSNDDIQRKRELKKLKIPRGVVVRVQPKGWNDATLTKVWLQKIHLSCTKKRVLLI